MSQPTKRFILAEDLYRLEQVSGARISPDGKKIVYSQLRVDPKTEKKYSNLWLASTAEGSPPTQFTYGDQNDTSPAWSPDGKQIAFISNRKDKEKPGGIYLIPVNGGEAYPISDVQGSISHLCWSPDGTKLLCMLRKTDPEAIERDADEQKKKLGVVYRQYSRVIYKLDGYGYLPKEQWHLWVLDVATGNFTQQTDHPIFEEKDPAWSPDGNSIVFASNRQENLDFHLDRIDLYVLPADGGEMRLIPTPIGAKSLPSYSPDGEWIAYIGQEGEGLDYKNENLWIVRADGSCPAVNLTQEYDLHTSPWTITDCGEAEAMPPAWSVDGKAIYFQAVLHGSTVLQKIDLNDRKLEQVIGEGGVVGSYSFDRNQTKLACFYAKMTDPGQLMVLDLASPRLQPVTGLNNALLKEVKLGEVEEIWYEGPDGNDLQGWVIKPPDFDPNQKYPSILEIHGGPLTQYGNFFMHEFNYLASKGYVVTFTNPRGGRGYGEEHAKAIWGGWGDADYRDLMAWTDLVEKFPYIDPNRMGVTGGSYGGYMTVWIIGHTQRFKAAVTQRCVSNLVSLWGSSDFNWSFQQMLNNKPPFEDLQKFWDHSPIKYIGNAKTPTLVIHNEMDLRCPIEQGEQVFVALQSLGVETEMVRFPDEFHGLSRGGRTDRRIARLNQILRWFENHL